MAPVFGQAAVMRFPAVQPDVGEETLVALHQAPREKGGGEIACREPSVMIELFAIMSGEVSGEFLDLNQTSEAKILVTLRLRNSLRTRPQTQANFGIGTLGGMRCPR